MIWLQATKDAQFSNVRAARIFLGQTLQRVFQGQNAAGINRGVKGFKDIGAGFKTLTATLFGKTTASMIAQDGAQHGGRGSQEMLF